MPKFTSFDFFSLDKSIRTFQTDKIEGNFVRKGDLLCRIMSTNANGQIVTREINTNQSGYIAYIKPNNSNIILYDTIAVLVNNQKDLETAKKRFLTRQSSNISAKAADAKSDRLNITSSASSKNPTEPYVHSAVYYTTKSNLKSPEGFVLRMPNISNSILKDFFASDSSKERVVIVSVRENENVNKDQPLLQVSQNVNGQDLVSTIYSSNNGYVSYIVPINATIKPGDIVAVLVKDKKDTKKAKKIILNYLANPPSSTITTEPTTITKATDSKLPIPNQLNITIQTNIPGYQKFSFKPSMLKSAKKDDSAVQFNPLIKLNKSIIDKIPESLRVVEFFNRGLFESLLNKTNATAAESLNLAKQYGYIDNNIKLTLQTIFQNGSVIIIGNNPYVIADVRWVSGDWKIDIKQKKEEFDINRIRDPYLYSEVAKEDLLAGEQQLQILQQNSPQLIYGNNFTGDKNATASGNTPITPLSNMQMTLTNNPVNTSLSSSSSVFSPQNTSNALIPAPRNYPVTNSKNPITKVKLLKEQEEDEDDDIEETNLETLEYNTNTGNIKQIEPPKKVERLPDIDPSAPKPVKDSNKNKSKQNTTFLKNYFKNLTYYNLLDALYQNSDKNVQQQLSSILYNTTDINLKPGNIHLSRTAYVQTADNMFVLKNEGAGNCFFIAVADAINFHNFSNPNNRIVFQNYGNTELFTQGCLRIIVYDFFTNRMRKDPNVQASTYNIISFYVNELNHLFHNQVLALKYPELNVQQLIQNNPYEYNRLLNREITTLYNTDERLYLLTANDVYYNNHDLNFLIKKPGSQLPVNPLQPFTICNNGNDIRDFFLSGDYWGDETSIFAFANELHLNVLVIENMNQGNNSLLRMPIGLFSNIGVFSEMNNNNWNKYLFLYNTSGHFELMCFNVLKKNKLRTQAATIKKTIFIFDRNNIHILPPLYIILLIFGSQYVYAEPNVRTEFTLLPLQMLTIFQAYSKMNNPNFLTNFTTYFPLPESRNIENLSIQQSQQL
jgi:hypothetical protein